MERKIGEIFENNGDWYQVVECSEDNYPCIGCCGCKGVEGARINGGECNGNARNDGKFVIFKKLEKVGEPYDYFIQGMGIIMVQEYTLENSNYIWEYNQDIVVIDCQNGKIAIEIKRNEDMEDNKLNLKPFDLEKAKQGKPVCTRDGRKARIICFDAKGGKPIIALIEMGVAETPNNYPIDGKAVSTKENPCDLMMLPEKKEGWVNVYKGIDGITLSRHPHASKEKAIEEAGTLPGRIDTVKISWSE